MSELKIIDCEQNSPEWVAARCGIVTASKFKDVLAKGEGKTRLKYMRELACERVRGAPSPYEAYSNSHMERGHIYEDEARSLYTMMTDNEVQKVGFMVRGSVGYSPDGLIGDDGLHEIKTKLDALHAECLLSNKIPSEHVAQIQGGLWVSGRAWLDFCSYSPSLPLFIKRVYRDEAYIERLSSEVDIFLKELDAMVSALSGYRWNA